MGDYLTSHPAVTSSYSSCSIQSMIRFITTISDWVPTRIGGPQVPTPEVTTRL